MSGRYYEEFDIGETIEHRRRRTVTESDNQRFCDLTMNQQPLHVDREFAAGTEFGQRLVNGLYTMSLAVGISIPETTDGTIVANLSYDDVEHPTPVFHDDTIRARSTVTENARPRTANAASSPCTSRRSIRTTISSVRSTGQSFSLKREHAEGPMTDSSPNPAGNADGPNTTSIDDLEWLSLEAGEEIVWADGPDKRTLLPSFLVGIPLAIVLVGILIIVSEYLRVTNTAYVVTNRALYRKTGVLSRDVKRIEHEKVQDISYSQSALGTQFGYGTVEVSTAGGSGVEMSFKSVPEPRSVQQLISELIEREHREEASDRTKTDVLTEIRDELRAIRTTLEESDAAGSNAGLEESSPRKRSIEIRSSGRTATTRPAMTTRRTTAIRPVAMGRRVATTRPAATNPNLRHDEPGRPTRVGNRRQRRDARVALARRRRHGRRRDDPVAWRAQDSDGVSVGRPRGRRWSRPSPRWSSNSCRWLHSRASPHSSRSGRSPASAVPSTS